MRKDTRKFLISVNSVVRYEEITSDDFDWTIKDLLASGYQPDQIKVWVEGNFRLVPEHYEVD